MPSLRFHRAEARNDALYTSANTTEKPQNMGPTHIWMLIGIVAGIFILTTVLVLLVTYLLRRRRRQLRQSQQENDHPYLTRHEFTSRRKMSKVERMHEEEELERRAIIRKSLASKTSSRTSQTLTEHPPTRGMDVDDEEMEMGMSPTNSLRDDWKEWEARLQRERSNSVQDHPLLSSKPSNTNTNVPISIPRQTRSRSPTRILDERPAPHPVTLRPLPAIPVPPAD